MLNDQDMESLKVAVQYLEVPSLAARITSYVGTPIENAIESLPVDWQTTISIAVNTSLQKAMGVALLSINDPAQQNSSNWLHMLAAMQSGAVGGYVGIVGLPIELPLTTAIITRSIIDIARSEGEDIWSEETAISCMQVFALGSGRTESDDAADTGYYAVRISLASYVSEAIKHLAKEGAKKAGTAPAIIRLIERLASIFGAQVSEKAMAQLLPYLGAIGGAGINALFMSHYQDVARGHFTVRRLERTYGGEHVETQYSQILRQSQMPRKLQE